MAMSKGALGKLVILVGVGYVAYQFLVPSPSSPPVQATHQAATSGNVVSSRPPPGYGLRPESTWPPLPEGRTEGTAAGERLLAANYYVVLDASGSMNEVACSAGRRKIEAAQDALAAFASSVPPTANLGLAVFENRGLAERVPLGVGNRDAFNQGVTRVVAGAGTPLRSAIELGYRRLTSQGQRQLGYGEYHLVVVTDGHASDGQDPREIVNKLLSESPVVLHTIGFCIGERHALNQPGRSYYRAADDPEALRRGLDAVLAEAPSFSLDRFGN